MKGKKQKHDVSVQSEPQPPSVKVFLIVGLFFLLTIFIGLWLKRFFFPDFEQRRASCIAKNIAWGKNEYPIASAFAPNTVLLVEKRNENFWYKGVNGGPSQVSEGVVKVDKTKKERCEAFVYKQPVRLASDASLSEEARNDAKNSKGFELSIGIKKGRSYQKLISFVLNVWLASDQKKSSTYDLNHVLTYFAKNTVLRKEQENLYVSLPLGYRIRGPESNFSYDVVVVSGTEVESIGNVELAVENDGIEFVSRDQGTTWVANK